MRVTIFTVSFCMGDPPFCVSATSILYGGEKEKPLPAGKGFGIGKSGVWNRCHHRFLEMACRRPISSPRYSRPMLMMCLQKITSDATATMAASSHAVR